MGLAIFALEGETNAGGLNHHFIYFFEAFADLRKPHLLCKREVQVLGEAIVPEVAALECSAAFEDRRSLRLLWLNPTRNQARQ